MKILARKLNKAQRHARKMMLKRKHAVAPVLSTPKQARTASRKPSVVEETVETTDETQE